MAGVGTGEEDGVHKERVKGIEVGWVYLTNLCSFCNQDRSFLIIIEYTFP